MICPTNFKIIANINYFNTNEINQIKNLKIGKLK